MRLLIILCLALFMLSSCTYVRHGLVTTMDIITSPYHFIFDDEEDLDD